MSTEILPCPVCGKPCRRATALVGVKFFILCAVDCPYGGTSGDTEAAAIAAHNTVAAAVRDHAAVVAERDALRAQLREVRLQIQNAQSALSWGGTQSAAIDLAAALAATAFEEADR